MPADTRFKVAEPSAEQGNPYIPLGPTEPLMFEEFGGINTATTRPGVDDKQAYWIDGFIPLDQRIRAVVVDRLEVNRHRAEPAPRAAGKRPRRRERELRVRR